MGLLRKIQSKLFSIENICEIFKDNQMLTEEVEIYEDAFKDVEGSAKDMKKLDTKMEKQMKKYTSAMNEIDNITDKIEKLKDQHGFIGKRLLAIRPFNKDAKKYRILKKRLKMAKKRGKMAECAMKVLKAKINVNGKALKRKEKALKRYEKNLRRAWDSKKYEIAFVEKFKQEEDQIKRIYGNDAAEMLEEVVQAIQNNQIKDLDISNIKALYKAFNKTLKKDIKNAQKGKDIDVEKFINNMEKAGVKKGIIRQVVDKAKKTTKNRFQQFKNRQRQEDGTPYPPPEPGQDNGKYEENDKDKARDEQGEEPDVA